MKLNEEARFVLHELLTNYEAIQNIYEQYYPKKVGKPKNNKNRKSAKAARKARKLNRKSKK